MDKNELNDLLNNPSRSLELFERYIGEIMKTSLKRARKSFLRIFSESDWTIQNLRKLADAFDNAYRESKERVLDKAREKASKGDK